MLAQVKDLADRSNTRDDNSEAPSYELYIIHF